MDKFILFFLICLGSFNALCQQHIFQGAYKGDKSSGNAYQFLYIHYEKQGDIFFYIEVCRGAPSYNSGSLYGRLTLNRQSGDLQYLPSDTTHDCTLEFIKSGNKITVTTVKGDCPFGYGVLADGNYSLFNKSNPLFFEDMTGKKIYFSKTPPDEYLK